jgi:hypothetical protein
MSNTIRPVDGASGAAEPTPLAHARPSGRFAEALRATEASETGGARDALRDAARGLAEGERHVDRVMRAARSGRTFSQEELLAVQAGVYRYTQELELASKLVDKATTAVKTTLQSQQ